jgi:methylenetetrahydrofolate reductase (NADPH)
MNNGQPITSMIPPKRSLLSIEIFPPKTEPGIASLKERLEKFRFYSPEFISVTYGAGGSSQTNTLKLAEYVENSLGVTAMAHLTCVGHSSEELRQIVRHIKELRIRNIMALRGDPPQGQSEFEAANQGFRYASELIRMISKEGDFCIGCAGYPEGHVEADSIESDVEHLKEKLDAGAQFIVTQFFLDNVYFLRYRDLLRRQGIQVPVIPGILPISNYSQITRFSIMCGCTLPARVMRGLHGRSDEDQEKFGLDHAAAQVEELLSEGVDGIHLYALNKHRAVQALAPLVRNRFPVEPQPAE